MSLMATPHGFEEYVRTKMYDLRREFGIRLDCQMVNTYGQ